MNKEYVELTKLQFTSFASLNAKITENFRSFLNKK